MPYQLSSIGIDYVAMDGTNNPTFTPDGDVSELRPMEVLFEEWKKLRDQNLSTPQIAAWATMPTGSNMWQRYLDLYNNESYSELVYYDSNIKKRIMFSPFVLDPNVVAQVEANGGRNDIYVQVMWAWLTVEQYQAGAWSFFSQCIDDSGNFHTSVVGTNCSTTMSTNSPLGTQMSASPSFMMDWASLPFQSPGKLMGLTFKKTFKNIFKNQPDNLFVSSFNEFLALPLGVSEYQNVSTFFTQGLPTDSMRSLQYMDTYAYEFSRDIEPTKLHGDYIYQVLASCLRIYRSGVTECNDMNEECCKTSEFFNNVWSMKSAPGYTYDDYLISTQYDEVQYLESKGWYQEVCTPFGSSGVFCGDINQIQPESGPFIVFSENVYGTLIGLYRCVTPSGNHFFSIRSDCEDQKTEYQIGWIGTQRANETIRALYRCLDSSGAHYHSLDILCPPGHEDAGLLGYVR